MHASVTALLVSHDGARWLPAVLEGLEAQTRPPARVLTVDTGSVDGSAGLLGARLGRPPLVLARSTTYPEAVRAALDSLPPAGDDDWVWLLHDDAAPAPDALGRLLDGAEADPGLDAVGPKQREWPSLRRLLEVGVTISGSGRRETGLESGEYDQGQHDAPRDVLAVNTAGMLVRRGVLEALPLDPELPVSYTDLDLGWRMARAGHRTGVVPAAVLFHVEASHAGLRAPGDSRSARRRRERRGAAYTLLANCAGWAVPLVWLRLLLGCLLRALGLLLLRAAGEAAAEVLGTGAVLLRPGTTVRARRQRRRERRSAAGPARSVRPLLAPASTPYRRGIEELGAVAYAARTELGPRLSEPFRRPGPGGVVVVLLTMCAVVAAFAAGGVRPGAALLPAPGSVAVWWGDYLHTVHTAGTGSAITAPAYLLPLAVLGTVLLGSARLALGLLVVGAVPLAAAGGYRFLRRIGVSGVASAWGAATYGLALATGGALHEGRVGTVAAGVILPWLAVPTVGMLDTSSGPTTEARLRCAWRAALWLALAASFAPQLWVGFSFLSLLAATVLVVRGEGRAAWPALVPVPVSAVLLLPWSALVWRDHGFSAFLLEAGWPARWLLVEPARLDVLAGRVTGDVGAPVWIGVLLAMLAVLALCRAETRRQVVSAWAVGLLAVVAIRLVAALPAGRAAWAGVWGMVLVGAWTTAVAVAAGGLRGRLDGTRPAGRVAVTGIACAALAVPVGGAVWWLTEGHGGQPTGSAAVAVPLYLDEAALADPARGTLVVTGTTRDGLVAELRRGGPVSLGREAFLPARRQRPVTGALADVIGDRDPTAVSRLADAGIAAVFAPAPVDGALVEALDATPGLTPASAGETGGRTWRLDEPGRLPRVDAGRRAWLRPALLVAQGLALVAVLVLAAPSRRSR